MHLKNFSLRSTEPGRYELAPAYDLLNAAIVNPKDKEELALTLNGKKSRITLNDFKIAASKANIPEKVINGLATHFKKCMPAWETMISQSFLSEDLQQRYVDSLRDRLQRFEI